MSEPDRDQLFPMTRRATQDDLDRLIAEARARGPTPPGAGTEMAPAEARAVLADFAQHDHTTLRAAARVLIAPGTTRSEKAKGRAWLHILGEID